jgi:hypothetical protein
MALGILILSTENKNNTATMIAASPEEVQELGAAFPLPAFSLKGIETESALLYTCRAWDVMSKRWEGEH